MFSSITVAKDTIYDSSNEEGCQSVYPLRSNLVLAKDEIESTQVESSVVSNVIPACIACELLVGKAMHK